jgi:hypothetical protein
VEIISITTPVPRLSRVVYGMTWAWGGIDLVLRVLIVAFVLASLPSTAYATTDLRQTYELNRFDNIYFEGPLPEGFGLPGYVSHRELRPLAEGSKIRIRESKYVDEENPKDCLFAVGVAFGGHLPSVAMPCQQNLIVAVRNRQLAEMPKPDEEYFLARQVIYILSIFGGTIEDPKPTDYLEWNGRFPTPRQRCHDVALAGLREQIYSFYIALLRKGFSKVELILRICFEDYDPRVITGASDVFNVVFGPWFYKAREVIKSYYASLDQNILFASGKTSRELGIWFDEAWYSKGRAICGDDQLVVTRGVFGEGDGSRHDAHMHVLFFNLKWLVYSLLVHIPTYVSQWARDAAVNTVASCYAYGLKWWHAYRTRSGDPDTTDGNTIQTDFVAFDVQRHIEEGLDRGDSLSVIKDAIIDSSLKLGYELKVKLTRDPTQVTFLSGGFMPVDGDMYWYPLPGRALQKMGWSTRKFDKNTWRDFAGKLNSYRDFSFVPFLRVYVDVVSQLIPEEYRLEPPSKRWLVGPGITPQEPSDDTWEWFSRRYSLDKTDEQEFTARLAAIPSLPYMTTCSDIERMVEIDMG